MPTHIARLHVHPSTPRAKADGLKGAFPDVHIAGPLLLTGPTGAGKSTVLAALYAALRGLATTATDSRRDYVGDIPQGTSVTLTLDVDGRAQQITRDLSLTRGRHVDEVAGLVRAWVGSAAVAPDLRDWSTGTAGDRAALLAGIAAAGGAIEAWDVPRAVDAIRAELDGIDDDPDAAPGDWPLLDAMIREIRGATDGAGWLGAAMGWAVERDKRARSDLAEARAHAARLQDQALPVEPPRPDPAEEKAAADARHDLVRQQADARTSAANAAATRESLVRRNEDLARAVTRGTSLRAETPDLAAKARADLAEVRAELEAARAVTPPVAVDLAPLREALDLAVKAEDAAAKANAEARAEKTRSETARQDIGRACADAESAYSYADREATRLARELHEATTGAVCRHCSGPDPLGASRAVEVIRAEMQTADAARNAAAEKVQALRADAEAARVSAIAVGEKVQALRAVYETAIDAVRDARSALREAEYAAASPGSALATLEDRERQVVALVARMEEERAQTERRRLAHLDAARVEYARIKLDRDSLAALPVPETVDASALDPALAEATARVSALSAVRRAHEVWATQTDRETGARRAASEGAEKADALADHARRLIRAVRRARDTMSSASYGPIQTAAREMLAGIEGAPVPYFEGPDAYGALIRGGRVHYSALSGGETLMVAAAMVYALSHVSGHPCRIVTLDGIELITPDPLRWDIVRRLVQLHQAGRFELLLLTYSAAEGAEIPAIPGLDVRRLDPPAPPRAVEPDPEPDLEPEPEPVKRRPRKPRAETVTVVPAPVPATLSVVEPDPVDGCPF